MNYRASMFIVVRFCLFIGVSLHGMENEISSGLSLKDLEQSIHQFKFNNAIIKGCDTINNTNDKKLVKKNINTLNAYIRTNSIHKELKGIGSLQEIDTFKAPILNNQVSIYQEIKKELNQQVLVFNDLIFDQSDDLTFESDLGLFLNCFTRKDMKSDCDSLKKILLIVGAMGKYIFADCDSSNDTFVNNNLEQYGNDFKEKIITLIWQSTQLLCNHESRIDFTENLDYLINVTNVFDVISQYHHKNGLLNAKKYSSAQMKSLGECFTLLKENFSKATRTLLRFILWDDARSNGISVNDFEYFFLVDFNKKYPEYEDNKFIKSVFTELLREIENNKDTINAKYKKHVIKLAEENFDFLEREKTELYKEIEKFMQGGDEAIVFDDKLSERIKELSDLFKKIEAHNKYLETKHCVSNEEKLTLTHLKEIEKQQKEIKNKINEFSIESFKEEKKFPYDWDILIININNLLDHLPNVKGIGWSSSLYKDIVTKALGFCTLIQDCSIKAFASEAFKNDITTLKNRIDKQPLLDNLSKSWDGDKVIKLIKTKCNDLTAMQFLLNKYDPKKDLFSLASKEMVEDYKKLQNLCEKHKDSLDDTHDSEMQAMAKNIEKVFAKIKSEVDVENGDANKNKNHDQAIEDKKIKEQAILEQQEEKRLQIQRENAKAIYDQLLFVDAKREGLLISQLIGTIKQTIQLNFDPTTNYKFVNEACDQIKKALESNIKLSNQDIASMQEVAKFDEKLFGDNLLAIQNKYDEILKIINKKDDDKVD